MARVRWCARAASEGRAGARIGDWGLGIGDWGLGIGVTVRGEASDALRLKARGDAFVIARTDSSLRRTLIRTAGTFFRQER
ncbi:hypothetical protein CFBP7900_03870 [Xanthomonas hortorum pv. carotae]|uniref:Uncharacterized protein n=1 Tax=Xanthomonas hortorum pv. carotae TaxID=487904 RepID=A0A6V7BUH3_9XANT|nr:hypothetical protein CFBP7900_03870 [Xanthomonas hortorum pv. carotae]CAD0305515.1 hypothetical protein CFBP7900_03870 [Xanthomonas hortorum pv. carotae]